MSLSTHYPYSATGLENLLRAAREPNPEAFGIVFKVQGNEVVNWMYADPVSLKTIAAQNAPVAFQSFDDKRSAQVLRDLIINLTEATPCQRQLEKDMASIRNAHGYVVGEAHASRGLGSWLMRLAASSALWLGTSFPNSTMML